MCAMISKRNNKQIEHGKCEGAHVSHSSGAKKDPKKKGNDIVWQ